MAEPPALAHVFKRFVIETLRLAKAGGKTAAETGRDGARTYASAQRATDTRWRLFRDWRWNDRVVAGFARGWDGRWGQR